MRHKMHPVNEIPAPLQWLVIPWGRVDKAELGNALISANSAQRLFRFKLHRQAFPLNIEFYRLPHKGIDLERAAFDLSKESVFSEIIADNNIILVTSELYAVPHTDTTEIKGKKPDWYFNETDLFGDDKLAIISTFLWDHLKPRPEIEALPYGRRALTPFVLLNIVSIVLDRFIEDIPNHDKTQGCPNDYCENFRDIDVFFEKGKWFCNEWCNPKLFEAIQNQMIHVDQLKALKRILNLARGKPANDGYDSCFISYGEPDTKFARRLYRDLKAQGVECWMYDEDGLPGDMTWPSIDSARRFADKILIICSHKSLQREGVKRELESQIAENGDKLIPISLDDKWVKENFRICRGLGDMSSSLKERNYADFVNRNNYDEALDRVVRALHWK